MADEERKTPAFDYFSETEQATQKLTAFDLDAALARTVRTVPPTAETAQSPRFDLPLKPKVVIVPWGVAHIILIAWLMLLTAFANWLVCGARH